jgi:predicted PurR-regulated permease PerM
MSPGAPGGGRAASDRDFVARAARVGIIGAVVLAVVFALLFVMRSALTPLVVALVIAYLLDPLIDRFEARRVPRGIAIFLVLVILATVFVLVAGWLVPTMQAEIAGLSRGLPGYIDGLFSWLSPLLKEWFGLEIPKSFKESIDQLREVHLSRIFDNAGQLLGSIVAFFANQLSALVGLMVIPVIAYYLLVEFDNLRFAALRLVPKRHQEQVSIEARRVDVLISGFIRGQLVVMSILAVLYGVGFAVIGIQLAAVIGLLAGLLSIIPYVGSAAALILASSMALLQHGFAGELLMVVGWYAVVQTFEGLVLTPRIVGKSVGMHPVTVIVALLIGGDLLGFIGLLVAVPIAAVVQVFATDLVSAYKTSPFYGSEPEPAEPGGS